MIIKESNYFSIMKVGIENIFRIIKDGNRCKNIYVVADDLMRVSKLYNFKLIITTTILAILHSAFVALIIAMHQFYREKLAHAIMDIHCNAAGNTEIDKCEYGY